MFCVCWAGDSGSLLIVWAIICVQAQMGFNCPSHCVEPGSSCHNGCHDSRVTSKPTYCINAGLMLEQHCRRWANIGSIDPICWVSESSLSSTGMTTKLFYVMSWLERVIPLQLNLPNILDNEGGTVRWNTGIVSHLAQGLNETCGTEGSVSHVVQGSMSHVVRGVNESCGTEGSVSHVV